MPVTLAGAGSRWVLDPLAVAVIGATVLLLRIQRRRRSGGWEHRDTAVVLGAAVVVAALVSPVAGLAGELFSAHMLQHLLLVLVAAPLLAAADPGPTLLASLRPAARDRVVTGLRRLPAAAPRPGAAVLVAAGLHAVVLWLWHAPALYEAAVRAPVLHLVEHGTLLGTAVAFWSAVTRRRGRHRHLLVPSVLASGGLVVQGGVLAALVTFAPEHLYPVYDGTLAWGLTALEDQRLAGTLLWVLAGPVYATAAVTAVLRGLDPAWQRPPLVHRPRSRLHGRGRGRSYDGPSREQR